MGPNPDWARDRCSTGGVDLIDLLMEHAQSNQVFVVEVIVSAVHLLIVAELGGIVVVVAEGNVRGGQAGPGRRRTDEQRRVQCQAGARLQ